jgi:hypothetical protein
MTFHFRKDIAQQTNYSVVTLKEIGVVLRTIPQVSLIGEETRANYI